MSERYQPEASCAGRRRCALLIGLLAVGLAVAAAPGCGGCGKKKTPAEIAAEKKKEEEDRRRKEEEEKKKKRPDFELSSLMARPRSGLPTDSQLALGPPCKPGHWTPTTLIAKTNHFDFVGDLELNVSDRGGKPLPLPGMPYQLATSRPVALTKEKPKAVESVVYIPPQDRQAWVSCRLHSRRGGRELWRVQHPLRSMPSYQYHFVVLAREPERYTYLGSLYTVDPPSDEFNSQVRAAPYYLLSFVSTNREIALPAYPLLWTPIAGMLWDDALPESLDQAQQRALLDWLHWGGHLLISGPQSLDALADSFLAPYLPATAGGNRELTADDFDAFHEWSIQTDGTLLILPAADAAAGGTMTVNTPAGPMTVTVGPNQAGGAITVNTPGGPLSVTVPGNLPQPARPTRGPAKPLPKNPPRLKPVKPISGVRLALHPQGRFLPHSGELVAERRVGRGRIVVSAFPLSGRAVTSWKGWDELMHAFLLRRPPRKFLEGDQAALQAEWADDHERLDAARVTGLRYFTRDTGVAQSSYGADVRASGTVDYSMNPPAAPGLAAWNDFNPVAAASRGALVEAARIEIPKREFVVWVVAGYLAVLVPLNWLVFRLVGRVEWAWVAAPVIAVACTATVIHLARLDIGFARSQTEVAVLEIQGDYPRGHLTRYNAVYTSLSESYDFSFDDAGSVIQPLPDPNVDRPENFQLGFGESYRQLECDRGERVRLSGLPVQSNDRRFVHSEEMAKLPGRLRLNGDEATGYELINETGLKLQGAGVMRRDATGKHVETAWLGDVEPGAAAPLRFVRRAADEAAADRPWQLERQGTLLGMAAAEGELSLAALAALAQHTDYLEPGEIRLTAASTEPIDGMQIDPSARQTEHATLIVAHLAYGFGPDPQPDLNSPPERLREESLSLSEGVGE